MIWELREEEGLLCLVCVLGAKESKLINCWTNQKLPDLYFVQCAPNIFQHEAQDNLTSLSYEKTLSTHLILAVVILDKLHVGPIKRQNGTSQLGLQGEPQFP